LIYAFQGYYPEFIGLFSNISTLVIAGAASVSSGFSLRKYWRKPKERFSVIWVCFTIGLLLWFLGEATWAVYTLYLGVEVPYSSAADVFWVAGYVPIMVALYVYIKIFGSALSRKSLFASLAATAVLATATSATLMVQVLAAKQDLLTVTINIIYLMLDFVSLSLSILGLLIFVRGNLGKSWAIIIAAALLVTWADSLFIYTASQGTYYNGHPVDLLYAFSYMFFLLSFYIHSKEL
jgi:hypothetical protein